MKRIANPAEPFSLNHDAQFGTEGAAPQVAPGERSEPGVAHASNVHPEGRAPQVARVSKFETGDHVRGAASSRPTPPARSARRGLFEGWRLRRQEATHCSNSASLAVSTSSSSRILTTAAALLLAGALLVPTMMVVGQGSGSVILNSGNSERNLPSQAVAFASVPLPVHVEREVPAGVAGAETIKQTIPYNINVGVTVIAIARENDGDVLPAVAELREIEPLVAERFYETVRPGSRISLLDLGSIRERLAAAATEVLEREFRAWNNSNDFRITVVLSRISITDASVAPEGAP